MNSCRVVVGVIGLLVATKDSTLNGHLLDLFGIIDWTFNIVHLVFIVMQ